MNRTETFQSLSHRFVLRSNDDRLADRARDLIAEFALPRGDGDAAAAGDVSYSLDALHSADGAPSFRLTRDDEEVAWSEDERTVIAQLLWRITDDTVMLADGYLLIHAGAVVMPAGDGVLILGEAGSGKTTLVAALVQEGFGYLSDEAGAIEMGTGIAHPWARPLGFTVGARALPRFAPLFAAAMAHDPEGAKAHVKVDRIRPGALAAPSRIRYVIDHRFVAGAQTTVEPLTRATAVARMGSAAPRLREEGARGLGTLVDLMRGAEAHAIVSGDIDGAVAAVIGVAAR